MLLRSTVGCCDPSIATTARIIASPLPDSNPQKTLLLFCSVREDARSCRHDHQLSSDTLQEIKTEKNNKFHYGVAAMQGWRISMVCAVRTPLNASQPCVLSQVCLQSAACFGTGYLA